MYYTVNIRQVKAARQLAADKPLITVANIPANSNFSTTDSRGRELNDEIRSSHKRLWRGVNKLNLAELNVCISMCSGRARTRRLHKCVCATASVYERERKGKTEKEKSPLSLLSKYRAQRGKKRIYFTN